MIIDELENFYGKQFPEETKRWISENFNNLGEDDLRNLKTTLFEGGQKLPDIRTLKVALTKVTGKKSRVYFWSVCMECGCEYDYNLPMCPNCYAEGFECRRYAVRKSEFQPPAKVVKYNKPYLSDTEKTCYNCADNEFSYCKNFGNYNWNCRREEWEMCKCKQCCTFARKANEAYDAKHKVVKVSDRIPLKRG